MTTRVCLKIEYVGTDFCGSQLQPNGRTVQGELETALAKLLQGNKVRVHPSGRTDAGVHARGMVVHFDAPRELPPAAYLGGLNQLLPADLAVVGFAPVDASFHARFSATGKRYRYTLLLTRQRRPLLEDLSWRVGPNLDLALMEQAARDFEGEHDFERFRTSGCSASSCRRTVSRVELVRAGECALLDVVGDGFLKNMVRRMVGCLVEIGRGQRSPQSVARLLHDGDGEKEALTAPPGGLCLEEVFYDPPLKFIP